MPAPVARDPLSGAPCPVDDPRLQESEEEWRARKEAEAEAIWQSIQEEN